MCVVNMSPATPLGAELSRNLAWSPAILRGHQKPRGDEATIVKAKKALATALTLLHEEITAVPRGVGSTWIRVITRLHTPIGFADDHALRLDVGAKYADTSAAKIQRVLVATKVV